MRRPAATAWLQEARGGANARSLRAGAGHPEQRSISDQIAADAMLAPLAQAAISPKVTAPVKKFYVQRGAHVHAGELLATLENRDLAAAALDNKGSYTAAQATYETATKATAPEDLTKANLDSGTGEGESGPGAVDCDGAYPALSGRRNSWTRSGHCQGDVGAAAGRVRHCQAASQFA